MNAEGTDSLNVGISYNAGSRRGLLLIGSPTNNTVWDRLKQSASSLTGDARITECSIEMPWPGVLDILRDYGTRDQQKAHNFRFKPDTEAQERIRDFATARKTVREAQGSLALAITEDEVRERLRAAGFIRDLRWFQVRDIRHLLSMPNGANFSVPGAGKTTVTFAMHLLTARSGQHVLVVCPKAAFPAWHGIVAETMATGHTNADPFHVLGGSAQNIEAQLLGGGRRFVINYDLMVQHPGVFGAYLARQQVHLIVDESHRMKAGEASQRGALLLSLAPLPVRRDVLSGTPMPQGPSDLASQLNFLWPGQGLGLRITQGTPPRDVLGALYVRTTKEELGLPARYTQFHQIGMGRGQLALYGLVRSEALRQLSQVRIGSIDFAGARKSVMRLLQLSSNPLLALRSIANDITGINSGIVDQVVEDGPSPKMLAVAAKARELARHGRKSVIWTIFTDTIEQIMLMLADLNPVSLYGAVPSGDRNDPETREGRLDRFHREPDCMVMIANPAAAGEGISLHTVCHEALYLDRSYVSTHFLQSIDRIHRLGLPPETVTNVHIFQTRTPQGLGCIDHSVSRRLAQKVRAMQQLLDDRDLHQIALDEETAEEPVDYDIDIQDIVDLVEELEGRVQFDENEGG